MSDINFLLEGFRQDLKINAEKVNQFYQEYLQLNKAIGASSEKYENILLNYTTEELKFTLGFLTNIYKNIEKKKHTVIDSVFDTVEHSGEIGLSVFFGNRILEKFSADEVESRLIRMYTLRRMLNALILLDDRMEYIKYLLLFIEEAQNFYHHYPSYLKENLKNATDFYQFMYIYSLKITGDEEEALGFLIKGFNIKKFMIQENILNYPEENNLFQIINIVGSYLQIEDSFIALIIDIDQYVKEFVKQIKDLKKSSLDKPSLLQPYIRSPFRRYINQFLTNMYILGFEEEYYEIAQTVPEIITKDHQLIIRINEILLKENFKEMKIKQIKDEITVAFNNLSLQKKESVLYVYYNAYISIFKEDEKEIEGLLKEIKENLRRLNNPLSLNVPLFRVLNILGKKEEALSLAKKTEEEAKVSGKRFLADAVKDYIQMEF